MPILLSNTIIPLLEQMERVLVGHIVDEDDHVGFAKQLECDLLKNVLTSNVNTVQFDTLVRVLLIKLYVFDMIFATLRHHVLVIELPVNSLIDQASFTNCWLSISKGL